MKNNAKIYIVTVLILFLFQTWKSQSSFTWSCGNKQTSNNLSTNDIIKILGVDSTYLNNAPKLGPGILPNPPAAFVIPVVVHVLYNNAQQNLSYNQILWQIQSLNIAFQKLYPQYNGNSNGAHAVNTQIQFCLAQNTFPTSLNWTNASEPGVMRYNVQPWQMNNEHSAVGQSTLMTLTGSPTNFPFDKYMNIWIVSSITETTSATGTQGYASIPPLISVLNPFDGIVIRNDVFGDNTISGNNFLLNSNLQQGKILAHEVGHYLGMWHTFESSFGGTCSGSNGSNCTTGGDLICDTPSDNATFTSCNPTTNSCVDVNLPAYPSIDPNDMIENFMDYEQDVCYNTFTQDQATKMQGVLSTPYSSAGKQDLVTTTNLALTGLSNASSCCPAGPVTAYFTYATSTQCNLTATFFNLIPITCNASVSYSWNFGDGNTSNAINPSHTYANAGVYTVTCVSSNSLGTTATYTTSIAIGFSASFVGVTSPTVCAGQLQGIKFNVAGVKPYSVSYTNGTSTTTLSAGYNECNLTVSTPTNIIGPTPQSYSVTIGAGLPCAQTFIVTYTVINCCSELIINGNFNTLNSAVNSDLQYAFSSAVSTQTPGYYDLANNTPLSGHWTNTVSLTAPPFGNFMVADSYTNAQRPGNETWLYYQNISPILNSNYSVNFLLMGGHPLVAPYSPTPEVMQAEIVDASNNIIGSTPNFTLTDNGYQFWNNLQLNFTASSSLTPYTFRIKQVQSFGNYDGFDFLIDEISIKAFATPSNTLPVSPATKTICLGNQSIIAVSPGQIGTNYFWSSSPNGNVLCSPCNGTTVSPTSNSTYTVQALAANGCLSVGFATVEVLNGAYTPTITAPLTICAGSSVMLFGGGSGYPSNYFNYSWSPTPSNVYSVNVSPASTTTYTLYLSDKFLCSGNKTLTTQVNVLPFGTFTITPSSPTICQGNSVQLNASALSSYTWSPSIALSCSNCQNPIASPSITTIYSLTAVNSSGCIKTQTVLVTVLPSPNLSVTPNVLCSGLNYTINASGANTYTWQPGNINTSTLSLNISSPTSYTLNGTGLNNCTSSFVTTFSPVTNPSISASSQTICSGQTVNLIANGALNYTWMPGGFTSSVVTIPLTSSIVFTVTGDLGASGCSSTTTASITVLPSPTLSIVSNPPGGICIPGTSVTLNATGGLSYNWNDGTNTYSLNPLVITPSVTSTYTLSASLGTCTTSLIHTINVNTVCLCTANSIYNHTLSIGSATLNNNSYAINSGFNVNSGTYLKINNSELLIAPNVVITVAPSATLEINKSHLFSCFDMWQGIVVQGGGELIITGNSLIEDALTAVNLSYYGPVAGLALFAEKVTFNKNLTAINLGIYNPMLASYPIKISDCNFTSRSFTYTSFPSPPPYSWPTSSMISAVTTQTNPLESPYLLLSAPVASLAPPNNSRMAFIGINLNFTGLTINSSTNPIFYEPMIGDSISKLRPNLFDNLVIGINSVNSNFRATNNIFQNTRIWKGNAGFGIRSVCTVDFLTHIKLFGKNPPNDILKNKFFNCYTAVSVTDAFVTDITECDVRSSTPNTATPPVLTTNYLGKNGIFLSTNRFLNYNLSKNKMHNISNGINFIATYAPLSTAIFSVSHGQYAGFLIIDQNDMKNNFGPVTTQFINNAITVQQPLTAPSGSSLIVVPGSSVTVSTNYIKKAYRGIYILNWNSKQFIRTSSNDITLADDFITGATKQYGINTSSCDNQEIKGNYVLSANKTNTMVSSYYSSQTNNLMVTCNTASISYNGFEFEGNHVNVIWAGNEMNNHRGGFVLSNNGIIGPQGTSLTPIDNKWNGTWVGINNRTTWTNNSFAVLSSLNVRNTFPFFPNNNSGAPPFNSYIAVGTILNANGPYYSCGGGSSSSQRQMELVVQDSVPYIQDSIQSKTINKHKVFKQLKKTPSLMSSSVVLQNFYASSLIGNREKLSFIEANLSQGNSSIAGTQLASFASSNNIESNYKNFYLIYRNYYDTLYSGSDSIALTNIAQKCPFVDGEVVYQARSLYNLIYETVYNFNDNCLITEENFTRKLNIENTESDSQATNFGVYPNPASHELFITTPENSQQIDLRITDVTGKLLLNLKIKTEAFIYKLPLDLKDGIYFVTLVDDKGTQIIKKLLISK